MKKITLILATFVSCQSLYLSAQVPDLPEKEVLTHTLLGTRSFTNGTAQDTVMIPYGQTGNFTVEVKGKVVSTTGRGLDMEARMPDGKGFRVSMDENTLNWTTPLGTTLNLTNSGNAEEQTVRFAVSNGHAHIYQNGTYISSQNLAEIKDIVDGKEVVPSGNYGPDILGDWGGPSGNNQGVPTDYGWECTGPAPWNTANSGGGVRYLDVNSSSGTKHTLEDGEYYDGRIMIVRWDADAILSAYYSYPVILEANTSYEFSLLYEYWSNLSAGSPITVGISTTRDGTGQFDSKTFTTGKSNELRRGTFSFTSKEAGQYYITFQGSRAMYAVGDLSVKKYSVDSRFLFGKNYENGVVDMSISSVTFETEAYAPVIGGSVTPSYNITLMDRVVNSNVYIGTNIIVNGKTDLHLTNTVNPLVNSIVNLNSNEAWLFFDKIGIAEVTAKWLDKVKINGSPAIDGQNAKVSYFGGGTMIIPNGNTVIENPLEVFTGTNYTGESKGLEIHTYHNELDSFDNKIKSFKLKRGYMATFANNPDGTGYSRIFIADDNDIEMSEMPELLNESVSFIRVFKWEWTSKKGWCQTGGDAKNAAAMTNSTWYYSWSADQVSTSVTEYVPMRHNKGWPGWNQIGKVENATHLLGFNEPDRPDQALMSVEEALEQWPEMMKSGLRIGSPAPSAPGNGNNWLYRFIDKCDSLNYRVDYIALHTYWGGKSPTSWYNDLKYTYERCGRRPLWITEWNNGANWTTEGWPADSLEQLQKQLNDLKGILQVMDTAHFIERYSIYNWVEDKRAIILRGELTPAGEYYADNKSDIAFNRRNEVIPHWNILAPVLDYTISDDNTKMMLKWTSSNGEYTTKYVLERRLDGEPEFSTLAEFTDYSVLQFEDDIQNKADYRIKSVTKFGTHSEYSNVLQFIKDEIANPPANLTGEAISAGIIDLKWDIAEGARSYRLKRSLEEDGTSYEIIADYLKDTVYTDKNLDENTIYYYKISSLNNSGEGPDSEVLTMATKPLVVPDAVSNAFAASNDNKVILNWDFMYDAKFNIKRSESKNGEYEKIAGTDDNIYIDDTAVNGTTYYYMISAENAKGESPDSPVLTATPEKGQHAYWNFDEADGTTVIDFWGAKHGAFMPNVVWTEGKLGAAAEFDGTSDSYIELPEGIVSDLTDFTIAAWTNISEMANNSRIFDFGNGTGTFMILCPNAGGNIRYKLTYDGLNDTFEVPYVLPTDEWVHLMVSQAGNSLTLYVNGIALDTKQSTLKPSGMGVTPNNYIVKSQWASDPFLKCKIDEFRIYNYALNEDEIAALMGIYTGIDSQPDAGKKTFDVILYPNPVQDILHIRVLDTKSQSITVEIYNSMGQFMKTEKMGKTSNVTIDVSGLPSGLYIVRAITDNSAVSKQILKK